MELINKISLNKKIDKYKIVSILFYVIYGAIWIILFAKCKYGYGNLDETYYLQVTHRIAQGDALIAEEWHIGQLFSYLLLPFMYLYMHIFNTSTGIVLFFRYLYTFVWGTANLFIYFKIKKINHLGAVFASIFLLIYAPFGIMALSYNSFGIMFLVLSCVLNLTSNSKISNIISGSFYSFAVLCCPSLVVLLIYYLIYFLFIKKEKSQLLYFIIGIIIQFIIFIIFVLSRASLSKIIQSIPYILSHPEHDDANLISKIKIWFLSFYNRSNKYLLLAIMLVVAVSYFIKHKQIILIIILLLITGLIIYTYKTYYYINHLMYPLALIAPFLFITKNDKIKKILYSIWLPGLIYSLCLNFTSNQGEYAIFSALSISSFGSIISLCIYVDESINTNKLKNIVIKTMMCLVIVLQISLLLIVRWNNIFWDTYTSKQNKLIEKGPEKGLYVSDEKYDIYSEVVDVFDSLDLEDDSIFVLSSNSLYYLCYFNSRSSSSSSWLLPGDTLQMKYLEINPSKLPNKIIYPLNEYDNYDNLLDELMNRYSYKLVDSNKFVQLYSK